MREADGGLTYSKANALVQDFSHSLTLMEMRFINYIIANINSPKYNKELSELEFNVTEIAALLQANGKSGSVYEKIENSLKALRDKSAWKWVEKDGKRVKALMSWIEMPRRDEDGRIFIRLNPLLVPYLLRLGKDGKGYFKAKLNYSISAKSRYTIVLYELLRSWERLPGAEKSKKFEISDFREKMDATKKSFDNLAELKRRCIDVAVREINEITDLDVSYTTEKQGRKTSHIIFHFHFKDDLYPISVEEDDSVVEADYIDLDDEKEKEPKLSDERKARIEAYKNRYQALENALDPKWDSKKLEIIYDAAVKHIPGYEVMSWDERRAEVYDYVTIKYKSILATPEDTKYSTYKRLLNMVENDYI